MASANRIGGIAFWKAGGRNLAVRGGFTVSPSKTERTGVAGQDRVHGFVEVPVVPFMEADVSLVEGTSIEDIDAIDEETITAELGNGTVFVLVDAWRVNRSEINTRDGMFRVRFEGKDSTEFTA
jgi:hypothetical protein